MNRCGAFFAATALCTAYVPVQAQNLLQNGNFDTDLSGWTDVQFPAPVWTPDDCCGNPASGSVQLQGGGTLNPLLASNCVAVTANSAYDVRTMINMVPDPGVMNPANAGLYVVWSDAADCSDDIGRPGIVFTSVPSGWHDAGAHLIAPDGAVGASVQLAAFNGGLSTGVSAYFDDVQFGPAGTVPVGLESFTVD